MHVILYSCTQITRKTALDDMNLHMSIGVIRACRRFLSIASRVTARFSYQLASDDPLDQISVGSCPAEQGEKAMKTECKPAYLTRQNRLGNDWHSCAILMPSASSGNVKGRWSSVFAFFITICESRPALYDTNSRIPTAVEAPAYSSAIRFGLFPIQERSSKP